MTTPKEALTYISNARWDEDADLDDICTMADRALASFEGDAVERVALEFCSGERSPEVKRGNYKSFIIVVENKEGKRFSFAAYYLNAYPLDYRDECPKGNGCEGVGCDDGCLTTGWFHDNSNFEYDDCFFPVSGKVLSWASIPEADAILATGLVPDEINKMIYENKNDGFIGVCIGEYKTLEGEKGKVLQQLNTKVVHVYRNKWLNQVGYKE